MDWEGTLAAFYKTFTSGSTRGGSTITQQLLREITEDDEVTAIFSEQPLASITSWMASSMAASSNQE